jgi:hypothetical protein
MNIYKPVWQIVFKNPVVIFSIFLITFALGTINVANGQAIDSKEDVVMTNAELAQILAPIALYPDTLLTHILIASTYPLEVIEAERWLKKKSRWTTKKVQQKSQEQGWDASITALIAFPKLLTKLSEDLFWMHKLGDAFLQDEAKVLAGIQTLRQKASQSGALAKMDNVEVIEERSVIIIEPAQREVIYVPYYDTRLVYGHWSWSHYPPIYWHRPYHYASHRTYFSWGHGIHISNYFFFNAFQWHDRYIVRSHHKRRQYYPRKKIVVSHNAKRWHHKPKHRRGVAYSSGYLKKKYKKPYIQSKTTKVVKSRLHKSAKVVKTSSIRSGGKHIIAQHKNKANKGYKKHIKSRKETYIKQQNKINHKMRPVTGKQVSKSMKATKNKYKQGASNKSIKQKLNRQYKQALKNKTIKTRIKERSI